MPNHSNNEIILVLQHFDNCVDRTVQAFMEGELFNMKVWAGMLVDSIQTPQTYDRNKLFDAGRRSDIYLLQSLHNLCSYKLFHFSFADLVVGVCVCAGLGLCLFKD